MRIHVCWAESVYLINLLIDECDVPENQKGSISNMTSVRRHVCWAESVYLINLLIDECNVPENQKGSISNMTSVRRS